MPFKGNPSLVSPTGVAFRCTTGGLASWELVGAGNVSFTNFTDSLLGPQPVGVTVTMELLVFPVEVAVVVLACLDAGELPPVFGTVEVRM